MDSLETSSKSQQHSTSILTSLETLPRSSLRLLVLQCIEKQNVTSLRRLVIAPGSVMGDNFMGVIYRVVAEGCTSEGESKHLSMILKCSPENKARREFFDVPKLFLNEANFYSQVIPGLECHDLAVAKCYGVLSENDQDAIVLEDLRPLGFRMTPREKGLDVPHAKLVLKELARLHAASLTLRKQNPQQLNQKVIPFVKDLFFDEDRKVNFEPFINSSYEETMRVILIYFENDIDNKYVKAMQKLMDRGYDLISGIVRGTKENERVVTHGDCWTNNLLFRYSAITEGEPEEVRFLDFQLPRVTSPAIDLTYSLFTSLHPHVFQNHYDELVTWYHQHLTSFDLDLTKERLDQEMARCAPYGMAMAGVVTPAIYCPPEYTPDLEAVEGNTAGDFVQAYAKQMKANTPECRFHLATLLKHCVDRGFFDHI